MKKIKGIVAIVLSVLMVLSLSACHPKDEVAIKVGDKKSKTEVTLTTAQYLYALTSATVEAQSLIKEANPKKEIKDYSKYKVVETDENDKKVKTEYYKWIKENADEQIRRYAGAMIKQKDLKLELDEATAGSVNYYAQMYWMYYYQPTFEKNGVAMETYEKMFTASYYENEYFLSIYDKDGTKAIPEKEVEKTFKDNYVLGNAISIQVVEEAKEGEEKAEGLTMKEAEKLLKDYKARMAKGDSFKKIYEEYAKKYLTSEDQESQPTAEDAATVYGSDETSYASEYFEDVNKMKKGEVKIFTSEDKSEIVLVEKQDINADKETYFDNYRTDVLRMLKGDEFEADFNKYCEGLKVEMVESATNRVKLEKIDVSTETPEVEATGTEATEEETEEDHEGHDHEGHNHE